jgi:hypothetical protein
MQAASGGWSHGDWIQLAVAAGTLVLGGATFWLGWFTKRSVIEAVRSRIDARAPRVVVLPSPPEWPPRLKSNIAGGEPQQVQPGMELSEWAGSPNVVVLRTKIKIRNDGSSTAVFVVRPGDHGATVMRLHRNTTAGMIAEDIRPGERHDLAPSLATSLVFDAWRQLQEWGAAWEAQDERACVLTLTIEVTDQFADGVIDTTVVEVFGLPVDDTSLTKGSWAVRAVRVAGSPQTAPVKSRVLPTVRMYRGIG